VRCATIDHFVFHDSVILERQDMASFYHIRIAGHLWEMNYTPGEPLFVYCAMFWIEFLQTLLLQDRGLGQSEEIR